VSEEPSQVESGIHPRLTNPLSEETRKERVYLLGISAIGITIVFTGLIPTEIRTLGITFAEADRTSLLLILALVVAYFLAAFISYALSDYLEWRTAWRGLLRERRQEELKGEIENIVQKLAVLDEYERELSEVPLLPSGFAGPIIGLRFTFEFILPRIVGAFAIAVLLIKAL
jgi:hypothetical protein